MEDKYYTPDITEFHPGFEYEAATLTRKEPWVKKVATTIDIDEVEACLRIAPKIIRVKYLDKEDIESLGWRADIGDYDFILEDYQLESIDGKILITTDDGLGVVFYGQIKNKSELRKIMDMVGIKVK